MKPEDGSTTPVSAAALIGGSNSGELLCRLCVLLLVSNELAAGTLVLP